MMHLPLTQWQIFSQNLPERLLDAPSPRAFSLPGADQLSAFADLIGEGKKEEKNSEGADYTLANLFEEDIPGVVTLRKEIDFGAFEGDRALLTFAHIAGRGEILLDDACIARFGDDYPAALKRAYDLTGMPCAMAVDLTEALHLGRKKTLSLRFDETRPAGVMGTAFLCVTAKANLSRVSIQPDAVRRTMNVRARVSAQQAGRYVLRVQAVPGGEHAILPPERETDIMLNAGEERSVQMALSVDAPVFEAGKSYDAPVLKIQLFARESREKGEGLLCDDALLICGYGAAAPKVFVPVEKNACIDDVRAFSETLVELGVQAVWLPMPAPDGLLREMTRQGIAAAGYVSEELRPLFTRWPCLSLCNAPPEKDEISLEASAWQMGGSVAFPRAIDRTMTDEEMLDEAAGKKMDGSAQSVRDALSWLRSVQIRLRAEAARQGRYQGALCSAADLANSDVRDALKTAFAPVHLSVLPLSGAWWTQTHFSASLEAFMPKLSVINEDIQVLCVLEDDDGTELAKVSAKRRSGGYVGVIEADLPDEPCVLTLRCMMIQNEKTLEETMLPVYVGERGVLEAAF